MMSQLVWLWGFELYTPPLPLLLDDGSVCPVVVSFVRVRRCGTVSRCGLVVVSFVPCAVPSVAWRSNLGSLRLRIIIT